MPNQVTYPVRILRDHVTALEAALSVCLAEPNIRAVHRLRTGTRRLEAQLLLLDLLPNAPEHRESSLALRRELRRLRRAAGEVRDLDVHGQHLKLLEAAAPAPSDAPSFGKPGRVDDPVASAQGAPASAHSTTPNLLPPDEASPSSAVHQGSAKLAERLGRKRTRAALDLQKLLTHRQTRAALAAEALLKALHPAGSLKLSSADLLRFTETVLYRDNLLRGPATGKLDQEELHAVRKSAKLARYLAETMPADPAVKAAAARFEALQEAGGLWHDALEMARASRRHLGRQHPLSAAFIADRSRHLAAYREALRAVPGPSSAKRTRSAVTSSPSRPRAAKTPAKSTASTPSR